MQIYKAIISDIDGTLVPSDPHGTPSRRVTSAVKQTIAKGIHVSLATGRPFEMIGHLIKILGLTSPVITDNGAVIHDAISGEILWNAFLPPDIAETILQELREFHLYRMSSDSGAVDNPTRIPVGAHIRKFSVHDLEHIQADRLIDSLTEKHKDLALIRASSYKSNHLIDVYISHITATKQHAVVEYAKILGIHTNEIVGIGDGYNDYPLLMATGYKIAMGNAVQELKDIADYVAPTVDEDGLATVLEKYFLK